MSVWKCYIIPITLCSVLYNIPKFLELRVTWLMSESEVNKNNKYSVVSFLPLTRSSVKSCDVNGANVLQPGLCSHNGSLCLANVSWSPVVNTSQMSHPETQEPGPDLLLSIEATEMRLNPDYVKFYLIYTNFLILSLIPFILLIIMNIFIYRTVSLNLKN